MNNGGEAADQMTREALQVAEVAIKLSAMGLKNTLSLALAYAKENPKMRGKTHLSRLLRENCELRLIPIQSKDVKDFEIFAKQYGVLYSVIRDKNSNGEKVDIMFKAADVAKLNRIYEQLGYVLPKRQEESRKKEDTRSQQEKPLQMCGEDYTKSRNRESVRVTLPRLKNEIKEQEKQYKKWTFNKDVHESVRQAVHSMTAKATGTSDRDLIK